jgi:hypothetical protein
LAGLEAARAALTVVRAGRLFKRRRVRAEEEAAAHMDKLRACFREHLGAAGQGHPVTELQAVSALSAFLLFNSGAQCLHALPSLSSSAQAKVAAFVSGRSERTVAKLWALFLEDGSNILEEPGARGARRVNEEELIALEPQIKKHVREVLLEQDVPGWVTRRSLQAFIRDTTGIDASFKAISRLCKVWGLQVGRLERPRASMVSNAQVLVCAPGRGQPRRSAAGRTCWGNQYAGLDAVKCALQHWHHREPVCGRGLPFNF